LTRDNTDDNCDNLVLQKKDGNKEMYTGHKIEIQPKLRIS